MPARLHPAPARIGISRRSLQHAVLWLGLGASGSGVACPLQLLLELPLEVLQQLKVNAPCEPRGWAALRATARSTRGD